MAVEIASAYVSLVPSAKGIGSKLAGELNTPLEKAGAEAGDKSSSRFGTSFGAGVKKAAVAAGALLAANVGVDFLKGAVGAASDLAESASKADVVFGDAAGTVRAFAKDAAKTLGQSQQQALEAAGTFGNLFTSMGLGRDAAADMSTEIVTLASDLASFNNLKPEEALEKLRAGLVGEVEPLRSLGVNFNAAEVEAKAFKLGLEDANGEISESAKVQARMALILEKTTNAQGDFARTSDGLANKQRIQAAQWEDLRAKIGTALLPVVTNLTDFVVTKLVPGLTAVGRAVATAGRFVADNREYFIALGAGIATVLVPALYAQAAAGAAAAAAGIALAAAWIAANAPIIAIGAAIAALAAGIIWAYQNVDVFRNAVDAVASFLTDKVWPAIQTIARAFTDTLVPAIGAVIQFYWDFYSAVLETMAGVAAWIGEKVGDIIGFFTELPGEVSDLATRAFDALRDIVRSAVRFVLEQLDKLLGPLDEIGGKIGGVIGGIGGAIGKIPGFASGVTNFSGGLALVGERGPELVNLPRGSDVIPLQMSSMIPSSGISGDMAVTRSPLEGLQMVVDGRVFGEITRTQDARYQFRNQ